MPLIKSSFHPRPYLRQRDLQSCIPALARRVPPLATTEEILELPDGDFLHTEWLRQGSDRLAIISHGLEGSTQSSYVRGMARMLHLHGWDVLMWNMRGCGSRPNRLVTWYHSGQSEDLAHIVEFALGRHTGSIDLVGFSVGGNITLKYLGECGDALSPRLRRAVSFSVPLDLRGCATTLARPRNLHYMQYLLRPLRERLREKAERFPGVFDLRGLSWIRTFHEFDRRFTAPFHGFASVDEYWDTASSLGRLSAIRIPTLIVSAKDDPFLSASSFPYELISTLEHVFLETPEYGGHVGFIPSLKLDETYLEGRAVDFLGGE